ncbi:MAG: DsrE family protein [Planctomycetaceae bacterium]|nr:DsrE family protein [Planctomycetaceae bacterium]
MTEEKNVVVVLTTGKSDNGKNATMAFSCALSAIAMGHPTIVFLTSDGAVWGFSRSADGITVQGFPPLADLLNRYLDSGGRLLLCSVCHRTCGLGSIEDGSDNGKVPSAEIAGFASVIELATNGTCITF